MPKRHDLLPRVRAWAALGLLCALAAAPARAEPLLTGVSYLEGAVTYSLFVGGEAEGPGRYSSSLHAGMALPASTRVELANDAKVMLSPIPPIRYLLQPGARAVNAAFNFRAAPVGGKAFDYRLALLLGTLVGDVAGPLRGIENRIDTPRGVVSTTDGHFLISVRPDGSTKYGVLRGVLTISVPGGQDYHVTANQILILLSDSAKAVVRNGGIPVPGMVLPEQGPHAETDLGMILGSLADDPEAVRLLSEPMPDPNVPLFATLPSLPTVLLLPGQNAFNYNPDFYLQQLPTFLDHESFPNLPNSGNTSGNPPISPILP